MKIRIKHETNYTFTKKVPRLIQSVKLYPSKCKNETKTKIVEVNKEDYLAHKEMLKKLKNPLWKKFNY